LSNPSDDWMEQAACAEEWVDPRLFHSSKQEEKDEAKSICASCPVRFECLKAALDEHEKWGIRGGVDEKELRKVQAIDSEGRLFVHKTGPIRCPFCGPRSTKHLEVVEHRRTKTFVKCNNCGLDWTTKKIINKKQTNW
jgi:transcription elongation factor Elf1